MVVGQDMVLAGNDHAGTQSLEFSLDLARLPGRIEEMSEGRVDDFPVPGESNRHPCPRAWLAFEIHRPTVKLDDSLHDGKPQAGAAVAQRPGFFDPVELIEHLVNFRLGDARTRVGYRYRQINTGLVADHFNPATINVILDGIVQNV